MEINLYSHVPFLRRELKKIIPANSFADLMQHQIGNELIPFGDDYAESFPVEYLFMCIESGSNSVLDLEWLAEDDGSFIGDNGKQIPKTVTATVSDVQKLALYGLYLIDNELQALDVFDPSTGKNFVNKFGMEIEQTFEFDGRNGHGWTEAQVTSHKSECLLQSYMALSYAHRLLVGDPPNEDEIKKYKDVDFSSYGKLGAEKRHAPTRELRKWATEKYKAKKWKSANEAAYSLKDEILQHGRSIGAHLSEQNAQRTFAEWFNKSV